MKITAKTKVRKFLISMIDNYLENSNNEAVIPVSHKGKEYAIVVMVVPKEAILAAENKDENSD